MTEQVENRSAERPDASVSLAFEELKLSVEAILFASDRPLEVTEIRDVLGSVSLTDVRLAIKDLGHDFEGRSIEIVELGRKYQLRTRSGFAPTVTKLFSGKPRGLSKSSLETLAIVAYRQPVTRAEINALRQVDSSQVVASLRERGLIYPSGTRKEVGHPVEYRTTDRFLDVFGLGDLTELPKLRSLQLDIEEEKRIRTALDNLGSGEQSEKPTSEDLAFSDNPEAPQAAEAEEIALAGTPEEALALEGSHGEEAPQASPEVDALHGQQEAGPLPPDSPQTSRKKRRQQHLEDSLEGLARPVFTATPSSPNHAQKEDTETTSMKRVGATSNLTPWISSEEDSDENTLGPTPEAEGTARVLANPAAEDSSES